MRTIIRFSLDSDGSSALGQKLRNILEDAGFLLKSTSTYESLNIAESNLSQMLQEFWNTVHDHSGPATFDHFWMYSSLITFVAARKWEPVVITSSNNATILGAGDASVSSIA
jgi:hypothetical protein